MPMRDGAPTAAGTMISDPGGRLLFMRRKDDGNWAWPAGGIEGDETPEQAARREMQEETGLVTGDLTQVDEGAGFVTFRSSVDVEFAPVLNDEHSEYRWATMQEAPTPLHAGVAATLRKLLAVPGAQDKREYDINGWYEVLDNPLSTVGVYQYSEASIKKGGDRAKMIGVYRPAEELGSEECIKSFKLMPWTDDHPTDLLGDPAQGFVPADEKGVHGVIGEKVYFEGDTLYGNLKVFSEGLARKIASGKKQLSCGYHCDFVEDPGVFNGVPYQYVQKNMRGNHMASVTAGRMGSDVRVLDAAETPTFAFAFDLKELTVREDEIKGCLDAETEKFICDSFNSLVGELEVKGYSKGYATKVAGKVAAEKGMTGHSTDGDTLMAKGKDDDKGEIKEEIVEAIIEAVLGDDEDQNEMAKDASEEAKDATEEEKEKDDESKKAKDSRRARDKRAGARDARKSARDARKTARDAKAAKDAKAVKDDDGNKGNKGEKGDEGEKGDKGDKGDAKDKRAKGMDAAEVAAIVKKEVDARVASIGPAMRKEEAAKSSLYGRLSPIVGAFDHAEMTHAEMAAYGLDKLGAQKAGDPITALDYLLVGRSHVAEPRHRASAQDAAGDSFVDRYIAA
jgi:8-oxo-dGTP pyrophosphatase MutT (NUDIX family)